MPTPSYVPVTESAYWQRILRSDADTQCYRNLREESKRDAEAWERFYRSRSLVARGVKGYG